MRGPTWHGPSTERLADRARRGSHTAKARLHRRLHGPVRRFAFALTGDPAVAGHFATAAIDEALRTAGADGFVAAALQGVRARARDYATTAARADTMEESQLRAVLLLHDGDGLTAEEAAAMLAMPVDEVEAALRRGRLRLGVEDEVSRCHGWSLVRRLPDLTAQEISAARRHLDLCRTCAAAFHAREAARARLRRLVPVGGVAGGGVAAASALLSGLFSSGVGAAAGAAVVAGAVALPLGVGGMLPGHHHHASASAGRPAATAAARTGAPAEFTGSAGSAAPGSGPADRPGRPTAGPGSTSRATTPRSVRTHRPDGPGPGPTARPTGQPPATGGSGGPVPVPVPTGTTPTVLPTTRPPTSPPPLTVSLPPILPTILPTTLPPILPTSLPPLLPTALPCIPLPLLPCP